MKTSQSELRAEAVRQSFRVDGRITTVIDAGGGAVLAESAVPEVVGPIH